jgi:hypothetical protein
MRGRVYAMAHDGVGNVSVGSTEARECLSKTGLLHCDIGAGARHPPHITIKDARPREIYPLFMLEFAEHNGTKGA